MELIAPLGLAARARILGLGHSASVTAREMVARSSHNALMARLAEAEARVRKLEAEAEMQGKIVHALIEETGATAEQFKRAALRACGLPVDFL